MLIERGREFIDGKHMVLCEECYVVQLEMGIRVDEVLR
jgi:hypothetical protein